MCTVVHPRISHLTSSLALWNNVILEQDILVRSMIMDPFDNYLYDEEPWGHIQLCIQCIKASSAHTIQWWQSTSKLHRTMDAYGWQLISWCCKFLLNTNPLQQIWHLYGLSHLWDIKWFFRLLLYAKVLGHRWQWYGLSPVWTRRWIPRLSFLANLCPQWLHRKGRSPVCFLRWRFKSGLQVVA